MGNKAKNLSEEQASQIAERIAAQLKQKQVWATGGANRPGRMGAYLVGAASGLVLALAAPLLRPVVRSAVKGGILVGRHARQVGSTMKEEFEDIVAEAEAELDQEKAEGREEV
jgi:GGDEF domain-containing protein